MAKVRLSEKARADLKGIEIFENKVSGKGKKIALQITKRISVLKGNIRLGMKRDSVNGFETRMLTLDRYDYYYQIETELSLVVLTIFDKCQDPNKLKL